MSASSPFFEYLCSALEQTGRLNRLQARFAVRLAIKEVGADATHIALPQALSIVERVLPSLLRRQGLNDGEAGTLCTRARAAVASMNWTAAPTGPAAMFERLSAAKR